MRNMPESVQMIKTEGSMKRLHGCWAVLAMAVAAAVGLIDPGCATAKEIAKQDAVTERSSGGLGGIGGLLRRSGARGIPDFDFTSKNSKVTAECGVDLRLVDPQTGLAVVAEFGEFKKTDSINGIGISVMGVKAESGGE